MQCASASRPGSAYAQCDEAENSECDEAKNSEEQMQTGGKRKRSSEDQDGDALSPYGESNSRLQHAIQSGETDSKETPRRSLGSAAFDAIGTPLVKSPRNASAGLVVCGCAPRVPCDDSAHIQEGGRAGMLDGQTSEDDCVIVKVTNVNEPVASIDCELPCESVIYSLVCDTSLQTRTDEWT